METRRYKEVLVLSLAYGLVSLCGLYFAFFAYKITPPSLPDIDSTASRIEQLAQAERIAEQAIQQTPGYIVIHEFYKGWILEWDYESLRDYDQPRYDGDSFEARVAEFNNGVSRVRKFYLDSVYTLTFLSSGSLVLVLLMLWIPGYLWSVVLATYPLGIVVICVLLDINYDPLGYCWIPFIVLGILIFVVQLAYSFRYGRPQHRTPEGAPGLVLYQRGLMLATLGVITIVGAVMVAIDSLSPLSRPERRLDLLLQSEDRIPLIVAVVGVALVIGGMYFTFKKPSASVTTHTKPS